MSLHSVRAYSGRICQRPTRPTWVLDFDSDPGVHQFGRRLARGSREILNQVYSPIDQSNFLKEPSHETTPPTHDRRHATAQSCARHTKKLYRARGSLRQVLLEESGGARPGSRSRVPALSAQRTKALPGGSQPTGLCPEIPLPHDAGDALERCRLSSRQAALPTAGRIEPRRNRPIFRSRAQPALSGGTDDLLRGGSARLRSGGREGFRRRFPTHAAAGRTRQGPQGPLRHALAPSARSVTRLLARRPPQRVPVSLLASRQAPERRVAAAGLP